MKENLQKQQEQKNENIKKEDKETQEKKEDKGINCAKQKKETITWLSISFAFVFAILFEYFLVQYSHYPTDKEDDLFIYKISFYFFVYIPVFIGIFYNILFLLSTKSDSDRIFREVYKINRKEIVNHLLKWISIFVLAVLYTWQFFFVKGEGKYYILDIFSISLIASYITFAIIWYLYQASKTISQKCI